MKILFNKDNNGAKELSKLTSNYYANNKIDKIEMDLKLETEAIIKLISKEVYNLAEEEYYTPSTGSSANAEIQDLVEYIQLPVALMATFKFYQANLVSHEDTGRKVKIEATNEKMAWEWMLDRDDQANLQKAFKAIDRLIEFLDNSTIEQWHSSTAKKESKALLVPNAQVFNQYFPMSGGSGRFYHAVRPFITEIQRTKIKMGLGADYYSQLMTYFKTNTLPGSSTSASTSGGIPADPIQEEQEAFMDILLAQVQNAMVQYTVFLAVKRFSISVLPEGLVQQFQSMIGARNASQPATLDLIHKYAVDIKRTADDVMNEVKNLIRAQQTDEPIDYPYYPENNPEQKYFRT